MKENIKTEKTKPSRSAPLPVDEMPDYDQGDPEYGDGGSGPTYDEYSQVPTRRAAEEKPSTKLAKLRGHL